MQSSSFVKALVVGLVLVGAVAIADFSGWKNNTGDLVGSTSLQARSDELDNRLGGTGTVAYKRASLGSSDTVTYVEWQGTCTNNETVTISEAFTTASDATVMLTYSNTASIGSAPVPVAGTITTNSFKAVFCPGYTCFYRFRGRGVK